MSTICTFCEDFRVISVRGNSPYCIYVVSRSAIYGKNESLSVFLLRLIGSPNVPPPSIFFSKYIGIDRVSEIPCHV